MHGAYHRFVSRPLLITLVLFGFALVAGAVATIAFVSGGGASRATTPDGTGADERYRIAAIGPGVGVILRDLGLEKSVVGRHGFDMALDPSIPVCGDLTGIDYEALLAAKPTHVVLEWDQRDPPERLMKLAGEMDWDVRVLRLTSLAGIRACAIDLAETFNVTSDLVERLDRAWSPRASDLSRAGRVLLLVQTNPPAALGPGSYHHEILERIGGVGALQDAAPFVTMDVEDVMRLDPDVIVLVSPRPRDSDERTYSQDQLAALLGPLTSRGIKAIERGHVAVIDDPLGQTASTALIDFADELAQILSMWRGEPSRGASKDTAKAYTGGND
jgi:ABC-type Fe3+-hydroxamate transport system substrate-binding protein